MDKEPQIRNGPQLWVVVCHDFHMAIGPFASLEQAFAVAKSSTDEGECVYVPVGLKVNGTLVVEGQSHEKLEEERKRGYL